jgi:hypothetical protein
VDWTCNSEGYMRCMHNVDGGTFWKAAMWKAEKLE